MSTIAINPYAVLLNDVNSHQMNAGVIQDAWVNNISQRAAISSSYLSNLSSTYLGASAIPIDYTSYKYLLPAFPLSALGITTAQMHQATQNWLGIPSTDRAGFPYTSTNISLKNVNRLICIGDSLTQGTGSSPSPLAGANVWNEGPLAKNWVDQLGETYIKWSTLPSINQGHGGQSLIPYTQNQIYNDVIPYAPIGNEKVYAIIWIGTNDILLGGNTGPSFISALSGYIATLHTYKFYIVVLNIPNAGSFIGSNETAREYINTNIGTTGANIYIDVDSLLTGHPEYVSAAPHFNDAGYAVVAAAVNSAIPNP